MTARAAAAVLLLLVPSAACGSGTDRELTVLAAASLSDAYTQLADSFENEHGAAVTFSFGSSTELAAQAAEGAPGDVLATADETAMQVATEAGVTRDPVPFATNELVIATPAGNPAAVDGLADLAGTTWVRCADQAPCGRVAREVLADAGIEAEPASLEDDARATLDKVVSGEAGAGLVYASDAMAAGDDVVTIPVRTAEQHRTTYVVSVLDQARRAGLAQEWVDLVTSDVGQRTLAAAGFSPAPASR